MNDGDIRRPRLTIRAALVAIMMFALVFALLHQARTHAEREQALEAERVKERSRAVLYLRQLQAIQNEQKLEYLSYRADVARLQSVIRAQELVNPVRAAAVELEKEAEKTKESQP